MDIRQKERLEAYLRNSKYFLWGLYPGNQKRVYQWLEYKLSKMNVKFTPGKYSFVKSQLINDRDLGIEKLITTIVVDTVNDVFPKDTISHLRNCWNRDGRPPELETLRNLKINPNVKKDEAGLENFLAWRPFVEINTLYNYIYVEGWGEFAGIWFEEIEPILKEKEATNE